MITAEQIKNWITAGIDCTHIDVDGDGQHFFATIVAEQFEGESRIRRHQIVYQVLGEKMKAEIHALSMKTLTPSQWQESQD